jgi:pimeloyl-ACP methyl ester carboxylesterase
MAFRIAVRHPDRVAAIITRNGNAQFERLGKDFWVPKAPIPLARTNEVTVHE